MKDKNGRPIEVGDWVATPYDNSDLTKLAGVISDAILGTVIEIFTEDHNHVHLEDGTTYPAAEIVTLSGLEWVTCKGCGFSWPFDIRMNDTEECPDCGGTFLHNPEGLL